MFVAQTFAPGADETRLSCTLSCFSFFSSVGWRPLSNVCLGQHQPTRMTQQNRPLETDMDTGIGVLLLVETGISVPPPLLEAIRTGDQGFVSAFLDCPCCSHFFDWYGVSGLFFLCERGGGRESLPVSRPSSGVQLSCSCQRVKWCESQSCLTGLGRNAVLWECQVLWEWPWLWEVCPPEQIWSPHKVKEHTEFPFVCPLRCPTCGGRMVFPCKQVSCLFSLFLSLCANGRSRRR